MIKLTAEDLRRVADMMDVREKYDSMCGTVLDSLEEINYVEVLPRWDENKYLSYADFFNLRHVFLREVLRVCGENGLTRTEDRIEDYGGGWFYIVLRCDWLKGDAV